MHARFFPAKSSIAVAIAPRRKKILEGSRCQSMFSALLATVFLLIKCLGPTFSEMEFPPQEPQPNVSDGASLKLYLNGTR